MASRAAGIMTGNGAEPRKGIRKELRKEHGGNKR
jgi:hypothetical protein